MVLLHIYIRTHTINKGLQFSVSNKAYANADLVVEVDDVPPLPFLHVQPTAA